MTEAEHKNLISLFLSKNQENKILALELYKSNDFKDSLLLKFMSDDILYILQNSSVFEFKFNDGTIKRFSGLHILRGQKHPQIFKMNISDIIVVDDGESLTLHKSRYFSHHYCKSVILSNNNLKIT